jgi:hypothetical protein
VGLYPTQYAGKPNKTKQITPLYNEQVSSTFYIAVHNQNHLKPEKVYMELQFLLETFKQDSYSNQQISILAFVHGLLIPKFLLRPQY